MAGFSLCTNSYVELYVDTRILSRRFDFEGKIDDQQGVGNKRR